MTLKKEMIEILLDKFTQEYLTKKEITAKTNAIFDTKRNVQFAWNCYTDGGLLDYDAMANIEDDFIKDDGVAADIDIYYLKCHPFNVGGKEVYVTEFGIEYMNDNGDDVISDEEEIFFMMALKKERIIDNAKSLDDIANYIYDKYHADRGFSKSTSKKIARRVARYYSKNFKAI